MKNELERVLSLVEAFRASGEARAHFARRRRLHPSAFSRLLRVAELPRELLDELATLPRLSRTHLEVLATVPVERRAEIVAGIKTGRSTYRLRERRETTAVELAPSKPAEATTGVDPALVGLLGPVARELGASPEEAVAFASELLLVLWRSGRGRVEESFRAFRSRAG